MPSADLQLDISGILSERIGDHHGISRDQLRLSGARLQAILPPLQAAAEAGMLPHLQLPTPHDVQAVVDALQGRPIVLLGEPAAASGAAALAWAAGGAGHLTVVDAPDAALLAAVPGGLSEAALVVLDGPPWVREIAAALARQVAVVLVFAGDGTGDEPWAPAGAAVWASPGSADARFSGVGLAAFALLAATAPQDAEAALAAAQDTATRCRHAEAALEEPTLLLAAALLGLEQVRDVRAPCWLVSSGRLLPWARWLGGAWSALSSREDVSGGGLAVRRGALGTAILQGDEAALQALLEGTAERVVLIPGGVLPDSEGVLTATPTLARLGLALQEAHQRQLVGAGRPVVVVRGRWLGAARLAALSVAWLHAAVAVAACRGGDPLTMDAADGWRLLLAENG